MTNMVDADIFYGMTKKLYLLASYGTNISGKITGRLEELLRSI